MLIANRWPSIAVINVIYEPIHRLDPKNVYVLGEIMVTRIDDLGEKVIFTFEGKSIEAQSGDTIASALAAAGHTHLRNSVVSGDPRGFYCMMGTCFDCLVVVDGSPNIQACRTKILDGMSVLRQMRLGTTQ